ncbi:hypothetical protein [Streptomyces chartreusis]
MATDPTEQLARLFAEESRVRAFAAVALGAPRLRRLGRGETGLVLERRTG